MGSDDGLTLVLVMAWCLPFGNKPLPEPMMIQIHVAMVSLGHNEVNSAISYETREDLHPFNSLYPERWGCHVKSTIFKIIFQIFNLIHPREIAIRLIP